MVGASPLGSTGDCGKQADLRPGQWLPYHKQDWPSDGDQAALPHGYQRSDSFPVADTALGTIVVQTFDFGNAPASFGRFDANDGGQLAAFSEATVSFAATQDGGAGLQLFASPLCRGISYSPVGLLDSWVVADTRSQAEAGGSLVAYLNIAKSPECPATFNASYTQWFFRERGFRISQAGELGAPMKALVSEHYAGGTVGHAHSMERSYFTKELGLTRWEAWANLDWAPNAANVVAQSKNLESQRRCLGYEPAPGVSWTMVDCREWTNIVAPSEPAGDEPTFWLAQLRSDELTKRLFASPP